MKALIIGGGIGGLATAIGLRQIGWDVEVYERAAAIREVGAGIALWANAIRALGELGLEKILLPLAIPDTTGGLLTMHGDILSAVSREEAQQAFGDHGIAMHRAEFLAALLDRFGTEHVRIGAQCVGFRQDTNGVVATFADGQTAQGDLLIGADGLRSAIRAQIHGATPPTYAGYTAWRGVTHFDHARLLPGESWGAGARFGRVPLSDGRVYWFATQNAPAGGHSPEGEQAALLRIFRGWHAPIEALISATDPAAILRNDIYDRPPLQNWGVGRVTLLGDAAHPMTPNLGQGACQALEDAAVLVRMLRKSAALTETLRAYESVRIQRTTPIVLQSRRIGAVGQWANPLAIQLRNQLLRLMPASTRQRQISSLIDAQF
jgi:2-polyprenyl-6-methoxyphenol hydroxylase-like FAD-dependent oxidoreductase